jgi:putative N6-adenine-specific DNA methylase
MMARNIAPGLSRHFRIESLPFHDREIFLKAKEGFRSKTYPSGSYSIRASDTDPEMVEIAKRNAERAGVSEDIKFEVGDFLSPRHPLASEGSRNMDSSAKPQNDGNTIVTNPPYGKRLESDSLNEIYKKLIREVKENGGGFITTYPIDVRFGLANKKLLNGAEECRFWYRK